MADAISSAGGTVLLSTPGGGGPVAVTVVSDSAAAHKLRTGAVLEGTVQGRASNGALEVATPDGVVQVKALPGSTLPMLPPGARLQFQMVGQGAGAQLYLTGINGRSLIGGILPQVLAGGPGRPAPIGGAGTTPPTIGSPSAAATGVPSAPLPGPVGLTATVIRPAVPSGTAPPPAAGPQPQAPLPPDLPPGTRLTVRIADILPPGVPAPAAPSTAPPTAAAPAAPAPVAPGTAAPPSPLPAGRPPLPPAPAGAPVPTLLTGTVTAHPPNGNAVVQTPVATLSVPTPADLPVGTRLTLEVVGTPQPPAQTAPAPAPRPEGLTPQGWPALTEALDALAAGKQPQALEQLLRVIPQPDSRLAATMVAFTGGLRRRDTRALIAGDTVRDLDKAARPGVAERLQADLEALSDSAGRPVGDGGQWRAYTMPMLHGGIVEPIRLFVRQPGGQGEGVDGGGGGIGNRANDHRFVLDFHLSQLGRLQLDGLVRRDDKLFDLILRTDRPLPADMRRDIGGLFADASELAGTKGTVSFQSGGRWMEFPPSAPPRTRLQV